MNTFVFSKPVLLEEFEEHVKKLGKDSGLGYAEEFEVSFLNKMLTINNKFENFSFDAHKNLLQMCYFSDFVRWSEATCWPCLPRLLITSWCLRKYPKYICGG